MSQDQDTLNSRVIARMIEAERQALRDAEYHEFLKSVDRIENNKKRDKIWTPQEGTGFGPYTTDDWAPDEETCPAYALDPTMVKASDQKKLEVWVLAPLPQKAPPAPARMPQSPSAAPKPLHAPKPPLLARLGWGIFRLRVRLARFIAPF